MVVKGALFDTDNSSDDVKRSRRIKELRAILKRKKHDRDVKRLAHNTQCARRVYCVSFAIILGLWFTHETGRQWLLKEAPRSPLASMASYWVLIVCTAIYALPINWSSVDSQ